MLGSIANYSSTAALFSAVNWVESTSWDGRFAIVVTGGIAASGDHFVDGAGACAALVGPNANIVIERTSLVVPYLFFIIVET